MTDRPAGPQGRFTCLSPPEGRFLDEALSDYCDLEDGETPLARREAQMLLDELRGFVSAPVSASAFNAPSGVLNRSFRVAARVDLGEYVSKRVDVEFEDGRSLKGALLVSADGDEAVLYHPQAGRMASRSTRISGIVLSEPLSKSFAEPSDAEPGVIKEQEALEAAIDWSSVHAGDANYSKRPITRFDLMELIDVEGVIFFTPDPQRADRVIDVGEKLVFFMPFSGMTIQTERIDDIRGVAWETAEQHTLGVTR